MKLAPQTTTTESIYTNTDGHLTLMKDCLTRTWVNPSWALAELLDLKRIHDTTISVVLPALNEASTIVGVIDSISPLVGELVDELVVVDSGSTDSTATLARKAGARVVMREQVFPGIPVQPGKGEVLWRSLGATKGDLVVFIDSDLINPDPEFVPKLLGPLLQYPEIYLVKGFYRRPLMIDGVEHDHGGGRVTELVARPLLAALYPQLGGILQPLSGECAARRSLLEHIGFAPGYGVDIGIVLDAYTQHGPESIAQVNLGVRTHRNRSLDQLAVMSRQIIATIFDRCGIPDSGRGLSRCILKEQEDRGYQDYLMTTTPVMVGNRPPIDTLINRYI